MLLWHRYRRSQVVPAVGSFLGLVGFFFFFHLPSPAGSPKAKARVLFDPVSPRLGAGPGMLWAVSECVLDGWMVGRKDGWMDGTILGRSPKFPKPEFHSCVCADRPGLEAHPVCPRSGVCQGLLTRTEAFEGSTFRRWRLCPRPSPGV